MKPESSKRKYTTLMLAGMASALILGYTLFSGPRKEPQQKHQPPQPIKIYTMSQEGIRLEIIPQEEAITGLRLSIDGKVREHWATLAPVLICIQELNYQAPFPVEQGAISAKTTFAQPVPQSQYFTYRVIGQNRHGLEQELLCYDFKPNK